MRKIILGSLKNDSERTKQIRKAYRKARAKIIGSLIYLILIMMLFLQVGVILANMVFGGILILAISV